MAKEILLNKQGEAILLNGQVISLKSSPTPPGPTPSIPTTLGSRIDDKATVVGVLQDHEGNDYVLAVVDAAYRSNRWYYWCKDRNIDTPLSNLGYPGNPAEVLEDNHTGEYNTDVILNTYTASDYPAFNFARNACNVEINGVTYVSSLPSLRELKLIYDNKETLDTYDPTLEDYPDASLSGFSFGASAGAWSSSEMNGNSAWFIRNLNGDILIHAYYKDDNGNGICPVICIPLS